MTYLEYFYRICAIPHGSGNEKHLSAYLLDTILEMGLSAVQDSALNIYARKPASPGYENNAPVMIQAHMDMVCVSANGDFDFENLPVPIRAENGFAFADGTTLGADDGVGVAYILALLGSQTAAHPPLEVLITSSEETGMDGAAAFDSSWFAARRLINLDMEEEGDLTLSCAGGSRAVVSLPVKPEPAPAGYVWRTLSVAGLCGGHSGMEIHRGYANANLLMARLLSALSGTRPSLRVYSINGGEKGNAIPRRCSAEVAFHPADESPLTATLSEYERIFRAEYAALEPDLRVTLAESLSRSESFTPETLDKALLLLLTLPDGVLGMSARIAGLVETSCNFGVVRSAETLTVSGTLRSSVGTRKEFLKEKIARTAALTGADCAFSGDYPAWEYRADSPLRETVCSVYEAMYQKPIRVGAIHAGLECGILAEKLEGCDIVAFGPDITGAHTPQERLSLDSAERVWEFLLRCLAAL